jgi:hypothetical protein
VSFHKISSVENNSMLSMPLSLVMGNT